MKRNVIIGLLWTFNLAFTVMMTVLEFVPSWYAVGMIVFGTAVWFDYLGWQRGFHDHQRIHTMLTNTLVRVMDRINNEEIKVNNKDDFHKAFQDELKVAKYFDTIEEKKEK